MCSWKRVRCGHIGKCEISSQSGVVKTSGRVIPGLGCVLNSKEVWLAARDVQKF